MTEMTFIQFLFLYLQDENVGKEKLGGVSVTVLGQYIASSTVRHLCSTSPGWSKADLDFIIQSVDGLNDPV